MPVPPPELRLAFEVYNCTIGYDILEVYNWTIGHDIFEVYNWTIGYDILEVYNDIFICFPRVVHLTGESWVVRPDLGLIIFPQWKSKIRLLETNRIKMILTMRMAVTATTVV